MSETDLEMEMDANEVLMRRWFEEVWNQGRVATIDELLSPDTKAHGLAPGGAVLVGPAGFKESHAVFSQAFPDLHITVDEVVSSGDRAVARFTCRGTHRGPQLGIAPTNRKVEFPGMTMARIENGQIVEGWNVIDFQEMHRQISGS